MRQVKPVKHLIQQLTMIAVLFGALALAQPLAAQERHGARAGQGRDRDGDGVPPGHRPPAGMCRIWIDGVPPGRQPAPTDCATAHRERPANARVVYGEAEGDRDSRGRGKGKAKQGKKPAAVDD